MKALALLALAGAMGCSHPILEGVNPEPISTQSQPSDLAVFRNDNDFAHLVGESDESKFWTQALGAKEFGFYVNPQLAKKGYVLKYAESNGSSGSESLMPPVAEAGPIKVRVVFVPADDSGLDRSKKVKLILACERSGSKVTSTLTIGNPWRLEGSAGVTSETGDSTTPNGEIVLLQISRLPGPGSKSKPEMWKVLLEPGARTSGRPKKATE